MTTGSIAVFATSNGTGAAALLAAGVALVVIALLVERLETVEAAGMKIVLSAQAAAQTKEQEANAAEAKGDHAEAELLRRQAADLRDLALSTGRTYERLRSDMGSSWRRTQRIEELFQQLTRDAPLELNAEMVRELFDEGGDGSRVVALRLMQHDPLTASIAAICDAIANPRSAMEQWQALAAAERVVKHGLPGDQRTELRTTLQAAVDDGRIRVGDTDRYAASQRLLELL